VIFITAGYSDSIIDFRGELIRSLVDNGIVVHVAAPQLSNNHKVNRWPDRGTKNW
jgi:hypothetical protein